MPTTHTHSLKVRYHEIDAYGHVNNANYARYMQEAAFEASAAAGFDFDWYARNDCLFVVRALHIEFLQQAVYGDALEVRTWISDARRVTARRQYEIRNPKTDVLVCKGHADWVLVRKSTLSPIALTPEMLAAFGPERTDLAAVKPQSLQQPRLPREPFMMPRRVRFQHLDSEKVVNNPVYLDYLSDCGWAASAQFGWPITRMIDEGFAIFYRSMSVDYLQPARLDDDLVVSAWLSEVKRATGMRHFSIARAADGVQLARASALCVCARLDTGMPMRWPETLRTDLAANISDDEPAQPVVG
jgi:YbgC/YbaW family acyl-CoA thioester hydrolase